MMDDITYYRIIFPFDSLVTLQVILSRTLAIKKPHGSETLRYPQNVNLVQRQPMCVGL